MKRSLKDWRDYLIPGFVTGAVLLALMFFLGYAPFGTKTLASMDASIQYLDLFAYYKDVLAGNNSIIYSMSKSLGGTNIGNLGYYLASPVNLLVVFFDKTQLNSFFDIAVILKLSIAAVTFYYFLRKRFEAVSQNASMRYGGMLLAICYGLCQYNLAQSSNIMWLDGVYMLPLILLGVYELVNKGTILRLSVCVCLSILFNWYTAGMSCLFTFVWLIVEYLIQVDWKDKGSNEPTKISWKKARATFFKYVGSMLLGVMTSMALFLPIIYTTRKSGKGGLELWRLLKLYMNSDCPNIIHNYVFGGTSKLGTLSLFAGTLGLICCGALFFTKEIKPQIRMTFACLGVFGALMFYWNPLYTAFSLFREVLSYWYRHGYLGIFILLFLAAYYMSYIDKVSSTKLPIAVAVLFCGILILFDYNFEPRDPRRMYETAVSAMIMSVLLTLYLRSRTPAKKKLHMTAGILIGVLCLCEMTWNSDLLMDRYDREDVQEYKDYTEEMASIAQALKEEDPEAYRIFQTAPRRLDEKNYTANYNEPMGYDYWGLNSYTSSPDDPVRELLHRGGYRMYKETTNIVNTPVLGIDSLTGVKYILAKEPVRALEEKELETGAPDDSDLKIYENPYCLPMAFVYRQEGDPETWEQVSEEQRDNPFLSTNALYSELLGRDVELYKEVPYEITTDMRGESGSVLRLAVTTSEPDYLYYGYLPSSKEKESDLYVNEEFITGYGSRLGPSVFPIPAENDVTEVSVKSDEEIFFETDRFMLYGLDLPLFQSVTEELKDNPADTIDIRDEGAADFTEENASEGERLFVSIPCDSGWDIRVNGKNVEPSLIGDCLYSIPLEEGRNEVSMRYHLEYGKLGIALSVLGIVCMFVLHRKKSCYSIR